MTSESFSPDGERPYSVSELKKFFQAAEQSPSQLVITDTDGTIEYVNPRCTELTGFSPDEILGQNTRIFKSGRMSADHYQTLWQTIRNGAEWRGEFLNRRKDGSLYWERSSIAPIKDNQGTITHFIKVGEDITEQKSAEEKLRRSMSLIGSVTAANLTFLESGSLNQMATILIDACMTTTNSPLGLFCELLPSGDLNILAASLASFDPIAEEPAFRDIQYRISRRGYFEVPRHPSVLFAPLLKGGTIVSNGPQENHWGGCTCKVCTPPLTSFLGTPLMVGSEAKGLLFVANARKGYDTDDVQVLENFALTCSLALNSARAELERKQVREQLRQAQKMEAIGQLAGGISHDFNNLLTVINGYSTLLLQRAGNDELTKKELELILTAGERGAALVRQLLAFGKRQVLNPCPLHLNGLVAGIHKFLCRLIGDNIVLTTELAEDIAHVKADSGQIEQIVMNLVINARDAMPRGGAITIRTANCRIDEAFAALNRGAVPGDYVLLSIRDNGMGMTPEVIERIFEPFFTTKEQGIGTGLGLATVYGIVKQSNGYIQVKSEVGIGTEFLIYLPQVQGTTPLSTRGVVRSQLAACQDSRLILVVEDEQSVLDLAAISLTSGGYEVLTASGPLEALSLFDRVKDRIDVVLTDIMMPEMTGYEMVARMRRIRPDLRVVLMSGYADLRALDAESTSASPHFILKPFSPSILVQKIQECLGPPTSHPPHGVVHA